MKSRLFLRVVLVLGLLLPQGLDLALPKGVSYLLDPEKIRAHVRFLADDLLEGRAPGTRGGELAARYIAAQFALVGLDPSVAWEFYIPLPLVGITLDPAV